MVLHKRLFFLLLVLLPTQLGYHFWPDWAYVLGRRVDYLSPTLYFTDCIILFLLGNWFVTGRQKIPIKLPVVLFAVCAINIFFASSKPVAIYKWLKVLEFISLGWYIVQTKPKLPDIVRYLSIGIIVSSILAIGQFIVQHSLGLWILGERTFSVDTPGIARLRWAQELLRPYGTFPHPNVLAGFIAVTLPLLATHPVVFVVAIITILLTFSRGAWIAALVGLSIMKRSYIPLFFVLFVLLVTQFQLNEESIVVRQQLNSAAIAMWQRSPIIGLGLGNYVVELPKYLVSRDIYFLQPAHNIYLILLSETGIIGFGLFCWFIWKVLKNNYKILVILLILGLFDHYPITLQQGQLIFTIVTALSLL